MLGFQFKKNLDKLILQAYEAGRQSREPDIKNAFQHGLDRGRGLGRIEGAAESRNRGCILAGIDWEQELLEIQEGNTRRKE